MGAISSSGAWPRRISTHFACAAAATARTKCSSTPTRCFRTRQPQCSSPTSRATASGCSTARAWEDEFAVTILDVDAGKELADHLPRARYSSLYLTADKTTLYYSKRLAEGARVYVHTIGSDSASDREIFGKGAKPER